MNDLSSPPTENMMEIQGDVNSRDEESAISEAKRECVRTPTHPSIPSLSSSKMMSYINDTTQGERDTEKGEGKGVRYIYTLHPHNQNHPHMGGGIVKYKGGGYGVVFHKCF